MGKNKTLECCFFNSSLRTRLSTQKAVEFRNERHGNEFY
jgi:ornithine carbamoyltransferase